MSELGKKQECESKDKGLIRKAMVNMNLVHDKQTAKLNKEEGRLRALHADYSTGINSATAEVPSHSN